VTEGPAAPPAPADCPHAAQEALRSVHTTSFPPLLERLGISLLVSTYQAGKLILVRADEGRLNTHFRLFDKPMGLAAYRERLAIGTARAVEEYRNVPAVAAKVQPPGRHDACYLPASNHVTGDIDIHEMAWGRNDTLWLINTRFSCLCTLEPRHSFVPRWRPGFVSALAPEDRCHLNGLGLVEGMPRYVTALGDTDSHQGWRERKANGGVLIDVASNRPVSRGLSMPHSPRWYGGHLWVLESGQGTLARVDVETGELSKVAELPGFTRGLDFFGPFAFIGLSQVRESATFSGIPLVERIDERICGLWVVQIETGQTVAFLRFEEAVQEIFAVQVLPGIRFPELLETDDPLIGSSYVLPDAALAEVADAAAAPSPK
jgi:uncharacterized protein (TIGR03032 family)